MKKSNYEYDNAVFYGRLDELRKAKGCKTFKDFARKIGIQETNISKWKTGTSSPRITTMIEICNKCGCDLDYLLGKSNTFRSENNDTHRETGLSEEAIEKLRLYKEEQNRAHTYFPETAHLIGTEFEKYVQPHRFIPELLSFVLTYHAPGADQTVLEQIVNRACRHNTARAGFSFLPAVTQEVCLEAYEKALEEISSNYYNYESTPEKSYKRNVREIMLERKGDILKRLPVSMADDVYENIEIAKVQHVYPLIAKASDDADDSFQYHTSKDLLRMFMEFMSDLDVLEADK